MKRLLAVLLLLASLPASAAEGKKLDRLSEMFVWWDQAYKTPGAFTEDAFRKYFTEDAKLILEGKVATSGIAGWAKHFQKIQSGGGQVEIVVPFKTYFQSGNWIYTQHIINSRRDGKVACVLAAGHAELRNNKIAVVNLVRVPLDPASEAYDPACWR